jgi:hypothetical protein
MIGVVALAGGCAIVCAMQAHAQRRDGGVDTVMQSIRIPPTHNAPFSAIVHAEWVRPMSGGGTSTVGNQRPISRDRDGRVYQERWALFPLKDADKSFRSLIQIYDPNLETGYDCFTWGKQKGTCELREYHPVAGKEKAIVTGVLPGGMGEQRHDDLGTRTIQGIETRGSRDTIEYAAGVAGNDQPMTVVREYWYSKKLDVNLISIVDDPRFGKQTFTLTDVALDVPDPKLFELPEGFQVVDRRVQNKDVGSSD